MKTSIRQLTAMIAALLLALGGTLVSVVQAAAPPAVAPAPAVPALSEPAPPAVPPSANSPAANGDELDEQDTDRDASDSGHSNGIVAFSEDAILKAGEAADEVVAIFGNAISDGTVAREVVAIFGNARVTGPVGRDVVAVFGNAYMNGAVNGDVVAVMGDVELGPEAKVGNDVVAVGGVLRRDPAASIGGSTQSISLGPLGKLDGLKSWFKQCVLLGRPLALGPGLGWAWGFAAAFLALYVLLAFLARNAMLRCVETLEQRTGRSLLAALIAIPAVPIAFLLLVMTVVGVLAIPFLGIALLCAGLFGKAVMLAWIGRRITTAFVATPAATDSDNGSGAEWQLPLAVLVGGLIVTVLYLVPIVGFVVYKALGFVGFGVVLCTLFETWRAPRAGATVAAKPAAAAATMTAATLAPPAAPADAGTVATPGAEVPAAATAASDTAALPAAHAGMPRAGFWLRMAALFLDAVLVGVVAHIIYDPEQTVILWIAVYGAIMWAIKGTTIGGSVCSLKVVRLDGKPMDWGTAIVRALGCFLSLAVAGLGFIWIAFDKDQQGWHDKVAGTVVVRTPKGTPIV